MLPVDFYGELSVMMIMIIPTSIANQVIVMSIFHPEFGSRCLHDHPVPCVRCAPVDVFIEGYRFSPAKRRSIGEVPLGTSVGALRHRRLDGLGMAVYPTAADSSSQLVTVLYSFQSESLVFTRQSDRKKDPFISYKDFK